jgi:hypothetical protein
LSLTAVTILAAARRCGRAQRRSSAADGARLYYRKERELPDLILLEAGELFALIDRVSARS